MPQFLAKIGYRNPSDPADSPFQLAFNTQDDFFQYLNANPRVLEGFANFMAGYNQGQAAWMDQGFYPVVERLFSGFTSHQLNNEVLLVDVGGGKGQDLIDFTFKYPERPGRVILQDLEAVLQDAGPFSNGIEPMAYDFFTPQPVKGEIRRQITAVALTN